MKHLLLALSIVGIAGTAHATKFIVTNNYNYPEDQYFANVIINYENQNDIKCAKTGKVLTPGKTTTIEASATYRPSKFNPFSKPCGLKSIEFVLQDKKTGKPKSLHTFTADELEAWSMKGLTKQGKAFGIKSSGDRNTGTFYIDMDQFDIELK